MLSQSTDYNTYTWDLVDKLSDEELKTQIVKKPDKIINDLTQDIFNKNKSTVINRELACKVLSAYKDIKTISFTEFFTALDKAHILEDSYQPRSSTHLFKRAAAFLKLTHLSEAESFAGLSEDEAMGKLYLKALKSKNEPLAYELLSCISDLDKTSIDKETCLADSREFPSLWTLLIHRGANINASVDDFGQNALDYAIEKGWEKLVLALIENGADINQKSAMGRTPLQKAAFEQQLDILKFLIDNGADIHAVDDYNRTPLLLASQENHVIVAKYLIEHGADINAVESFSGNTALHIACENNNSEFVQWLIDHNADLSVINNNGETPFSIAYNGDSEDIVLALIKNGAKVNITDSTEKNVLTIPCLKGWKDVVLALLEKGADVNARSQVSTSIIVEGSRQKFINNPTMLQLACEKGQKDIASILIEHGADVKAKDKFNATALHYVALNGWDDLASVLIEKGADPNALESRGTTPLICAWHNNHESTALTLIAKGADFKSINFPSAKPYLIQALKFLGYSEEQLSFLDEAEDFEMFETLLVSNLPSLLRNSESNPLFLALLLRSPAITKEIKKNLSEEEFLNCIRDFNNKFPSNKLENVIFEVDTDHFALETTAQAHIPDAPNIDLEELKTLFNTINFTNPNEKWYRDPHKLTDEGSPVTPELLKKGLDDLIARIKNKSPFMGTPPEGTQELKDYYDGFEKLLKHIASYIKNMEPDEQATHLIDVAIMGRHCGGKIGEADSMYKILSQTPPEGLEAPIYTELQQMRLGILMDWSSKLPASYQTHGYNQYMHLVGQELKLPNADMLSRPDQLALDVGVNLTKQNALDKFYGEYTTSKLIDLVQQKLWELYQDPKTQDLAISWLTDHVPDTWNQKLYKEVYREVAEMEKAKKTRKEIFSMLSTKYDIFLRADETPEDAIEDHQTKAYMNQKNPDVEKAEDWNPEFYDPIKKELAALKDADRSKIESTLKKHGIPIRHAMDFNDALRQNRQAAYLDEAFITNEDEIVTGISRSAAINAASVLKIVKEIKS